MTSLETAIRLIIIGQQVLIALVFLFGSGSRSARISGALLLFAVAAYLLRTSPVLSQSVSGVLPVVSLLATGLPYFLWTFAKCVFDSSLPPRWLIGSFVALGIGCWLVFVFEDNFSDAVAAATATTTRIISLVIVANTLWLSAVGRRDDLLEQRRRFRPIFVTLVSMQVTAVLIVELSLGMDLPPPWLSMLNVTLIGLMTMGLAIPLLRLSEDFFPARSQTCKTEPEETKPPLAAADRVLSDKLVAAMDDGLYRRSGLTISALAEELGYPEHQLRRLINRHLGFRNFSFFLNGLRIEEATTRLSDPAHARTPVLTIALDLGYGSLGPFNRAFKELTGMTPTAYREQAIHADSE